MFVYVLFELLLVVIKLELKIANGTGLVCRVVVVHVLFKLLLRVVRWENEVTDRAQLLGIPCGIMESETVEVPY